MLKHLFKALIFVAVLALLLYDSRSHFSEKNVQLKRQNSSAQRNWNIFYGQRFVYYDGVFRYQRDLDQISNLIEPGQVAFSDLATSYYAAASLPVFVRNVQRHHGRWQSPAWLKMLDNNVACNLHIEDSFVAFKEFLAEDRKASETENQPKFRYVLVNKDVNNKNVRLDCLSNRREMFMQNITRLATLKYSGDFINLYEIENASSTPASKGD